MPGATPAKRARPLSGPRSCCTAFVTHFNPAVSTLFRHPASPTSLCPRFTSPSRCRTLSPTTPLPSHLPIPQYPRSSPPTPTATASSPLSPSQDVPESVLKAVETLSRQPRQTIADIAAASGLPVDDAQLQAAKLAALTKTPIDVTSAGELAYRFPPNVRQLLRSASFRAALRMNWDKFAPLLFTSARIAFGALLIISIVVTFLALAALSASSRSDDDRRDRSSSFMPVRMFAPNPFDIIWYSRGPYYSYDAPRDPSEMSFLESVYSFVFGDADPNAGLDARRYRTLAALIRANNGAVTAEQLAPYLDPSEASSSVVDESYVLPVLVRFQGRPEVTEQGDIIYVFPDFVRTGSSISRVEFAGVASSSPLTETERELSRATFSQKAMVVALGVANLIGVLALGSKLVAIPAVAYQGEFIAFIRTIYPLLAAYATSFFAVPLARFFRLRNVNAGIRARNRARVAAAQRLTRGNPEIERKIRAARAFAQKTSVVQSSDVVYSSDLDALEQTGVEEGLQDDFDRRLSER